MVNLSKSESKDMKTAEIRICTNVGMNKSSKTVSGSKLLDLCRKYGIGDFDK